MAITILGPVSSFANNGAAATVNLSGLSLVENDIVIVSSAAPSVTGSAPTVSSPSGVYTGIQNHTGSAANRPTIASWYRVQPATPDSSVTVTGDTSANTDTTVTAIGLRGADTSTIFDATYQTAGETASATPDAPTIITATDGAVVVILCCHSGTTAAAITVPAAYSGNSVVQAGSDTVDHQHGMAAREVASHGTENPAAWTGGTAASYWYAVTIAVKPYSTAPLTYTASDDLNGVF